MPFFRVIVFLLAFIHLGACTGGESYTIDAPVQVERFYVGTEKPEGYQRAFLDVSIALNVARQRKAKGVEVEIIISDGTYYLEEPLILTPEFSGNPQHPFVIRAENEREVVLSGANVIFPKWAPYNKNLFVAELDTKAFDVFFVNGEQRVRARYPNYQPDIRPFGGYAADAIDSERTAHWKNPTTGYFHALHDGRWGGWHHAILGRRDDGSIILGEGVGNNRSSKPHADFQFVENVFEELDAPGEWFYDREQKKIYYYPGANEDLTTAIFATSRHENLIELRGTTDNPVKNVEIRGITFTATAQTFLKTTEPLLRSDWMISRTAAVVFEGTENSFVRRSVFEDLGGNAVLLTGYNRGSGAVGNKIANIGASGISVVGLPEAVRSPSFTYLDFVPLEEIDSKMGPKTEDYPADILIEDNLIYNIGFIEKQVAGVQISMAARVTVRANSIYDVPRAGINIGDGTWGGHVLEFNDVFNTVLETGDHGAFNSWGRDRFWHPDRTTMDVIAKDNPELIFADAMEPVTIQNNRFQSDHGWDIDLDDGSSNYIIRNNLCLSGGLKLREGFGRIVDNNIMLNNSFHPHVWFENSQDVFRHNIVMTDYKPIWVDHWGLEIDDNFFPTEAALEKSHRLELDTRSAFGDPQFVDPANGNFQVADNSGALSVGFKNFPMEFGVKSDWLLEQTKTPNVPELFLSSATEQGETTREFLGAEIRSVLSLGDQSAFGLSTIKGVIVLNADVGSTAYEGGLRAKDVIVGAFDDWNSTPEEITDVSALLSSSQARRWTGKLSFVVIRNQQPVNVFIDLIR